MARPPPNWPQISLTFHRRALERRLMRVSSGSISSNTQATTTGVNRANVVNQAFRVVALRAGAGEILFF